VKSLPVGLPRRCRSAALALNRRPAERIRPQAVGKRQKAPPRAEGCPVEARASGETSAGMQFSAYAVEPTAGDLLSTAYKPAEARRKRQRAVNRRLVGREGAGAGEAAMLPATERKRT
jgi:hypothetical protein